MNAAPLCRDCLTFATEVGAARCSVCGSPRLLRHPERDVLSIAHVDCDAFYAAVEKRDNPSLADQPVIIGGRKRGVVSTCCYVARTFGVGALGPLAAQLNPSISVGSSEARVFVGAALWIVAAVMLHSLAYRLLGKLE